ENANSVVFAKSGAGKSYAVKLEVLRSLMFGIDAIVIDPEQEYLELCKAVGGNYINFSSQSPIKINPFDLSLVNESGENELGRKILTLTGFLRLVLGEMDAGQAAILDRAITTTYRLKGITNDPKTQHLTPPLMEDLYKVLAGMEEPQAVELAFRLERFIKGSLSGIFSASSNINLDNPMIVFSVRDLADQLRPLAMYLILDFIWTKIRTMLKKRLLVVDEAWYMMKNPDSAEFLVGIAKRARKYYLGVTTITQDVEDFLAGDHGKEIISNSSIQILLKQAPSSIDKIGQVFNLSEGEKRLLLSAGIGQGLFFAGPTHVAMTVVASPEEHELITSNPAELLRRQENITQVAVAA
ncbi:ATP-binding protein, partial [Candidatus Daviesbacteria bacterium]|nr:ATP-binding protein [Candidatus Daviesbacteria bacterium]